MAPMQLARWSNWTARNFVHELRGVLEAMGGVSVAILAAIIIGTLYLGREVFVPIALAILLGFVLAPLVGCFSVAHPARAIRRQCRFLAFVSIFALGG
jgi:predicted PurR-regulated permease PerM